MKATFVRQVFGAGPNISRYLYELDSTLECDGVLRCTDCIGYGCPWCGATGVYAGYRETDYIVVDVASEPAGNGSRRVAHVSISAADEYGNPITADPLHTYPSQQTTPVDEIRKAGQEALREAGYDVSDPTGR